ncbi:MAG: hypothetical protein RL150_678 [Candidatus Parcubacteria bacterium]|jgi:hypothetical protein
MKLLSLIALVCAIVIPNTIFGEDINPDSKQPSLVVNKDLGFVYLQKSVPPADVLARKEEEVLKETARQLFEKWTEHKGQKILITGSEPKWIVHMENKKGYVILTVAFARISHAIDSTIIAQTID